MDKAINKTTKRLINAFEVFKNASYQNLDKGEWIAPTNSISNWEELKELGIKEVPVHYIKEKEYINFKGTSVWTSPCFAVYPNSPARTIPIDPTHKMLEDFLFNRFRNDDISFIYSKATKKSIYNNKIKLSELDIDWNEYDIEVTIKSMKTLRADILIPFHKKDIWLGKGIFLEIQLSNQSKNETFNRSIARAIQGYSTVWIYKDDFIYDKKGVVIDLNKKEFKIHSWSSEIKYNGDKIIRNLKLTVEQECRLIDDKMLDIKEMSKSIDDKSTNIYLELKKQIDGYFAFKIRELGDNFNEIIVNKIQEDFFNRNEHKVKDIIAQHIPNIINKEALKEAILKIDIEKLKDIIINNVEFELELNNLESIFIWKKLIQNSPLCPSCNNHYKLINTKKGSYVYLCEYCTKWINIPPEIQKKINEAK